MNLKSNICLFDPGMKDNFGNPSKNLGDLIIQEAIRRELQSIFGEQKIPAIATHSVPDQEAIKIAQNSNLAFVGGTNLLQSDMRRGRMWHITTKQRIKLFSKVVLFGNGWQNYQNEPTFYTRSILWFTLSKKIMHSVRDGYTEGKLKSIGLKNVINTGCPTMWPFLDFKFHEIPTTKSNSVLIILTDYSKNIWSDKKLIELAFDNYETVYFWPQGSEDKSYIRNLICSQPEKAIILEHSLESFYNLLESGINFDYIGTRLHGGIKCILSKKRSLILEIDNRAREIAKDTGLPTVPRDELRQIEQWMFSSKPINISLNRNAIETWKQQFNRISNKQGLITARA